MSRLEITEEEAARERELLVRWIVAMFDVESGVDVSGDLAAVARVREAALAAHEHRMALRVHDECVIDLPALAPGADFHHVLSLGTLAVVCTGERPPPDPERVRADRLREKREAEERAAEERARERERKKSTWIPFLVAMGICAAIVVSTVFGIRSCAREGHERERDEKVEHRK